MHNCARTQTSRLIPKHNVLCRDNYGTSNKTRSSASAEILVVSDVDDAIQGHSRSSVVVATDTAYMSFYTVSEKMTLM